MKETPTVIMQRKRSSNVEVKEVFARIAETIVNDFVATYQSAGECALIMRLLNGQEFLLSVQER